MLVGLPALQKWFEHTDKHVRTFDDMRPTSVLSKMKAAHNHLAHNVDSQTLA